MLPTVVLTGRLNCVHPFDSKANSQLPFDVHIAHMFPSSSSAPYNLHYFRGGASQMSDHGNKHGPPHCHRC